MQFSMGIWDWLFGEKIEIPLPTGQSRTVTKRWFREMQRQGKIRVVGEAVQVHIFNGGRRIADPTAPISEVFKTEQWPIGTQVSKETVAKHRDPDSGDLYASLKLSAVKRPPTLEPVFISRQEWEQRRAEFVAEYYGDSHDAAATIRVHSIGRTPDFDDPHDFDEWMMDGGDTYTVESWQIGVQISQVDVKKWRDPQSGDLYIVNQIVDGKWKYACCTRDAFTTVKATMDGLRR